jgi:hypothetical protein
VHPIQQSAQKQGDFWLRPYFTSWTGQSLVTADEVLLRLIGGPDLSSQPKVRGTAPDIQLRYGTNYSFRVRLADHTGGGPTLAGAPAIPGPSPIANIAFRRWIRLMSPALITLPSSELRGNPDFDRPPTFLELKRPLLHYPVVECTGYPNAIPLLLADFSKAVSEKREPGLPDPDVVGVRVTVEVAGLLQDPLATDEGYVPLFHTSRAFPNDPAATLHLDIQWQDFPQVTELAAQEPSSGPLILPTSRNIRLRIVAECKPDPSLAYFGNDDVRYGPGIQVELGKHSSS